MRWREVWTVAVALGLAGFTAAWVCLRLLLFCAVVCVLGSGCVTAVAIVGGTVGGAVAGASLGASVARGVVSAPLVPEPEPGKPLPSDKELDRAAAIQDAVSPKVVRP